MLEVAIGCRRYGAPSPGRRRRPRLLGCSAELGPEGCFEESRGGGGLGPKVGASKAVDVEDARSRLWGDAAQRPEGAPAPGGAPESMKRGRGGATPEPAKGLQTGGACGGLAEGSGPKVPRRSLWRPRRRVLRFCWWRRTKAPEVAPVDRRHAVCFGGTPEVVRSFGLGGVRAAFGWWPKVSRGWLGPPVCRFLWADTLFECSGR